SSGAPSAGGCGRRRWLRPRSARRAGHVSASAVGPCASAASPALEPVAEPVAALPGAGVLDRRRPLLTGDDRVADAVAGEGLVGGAGAEAAVGVDGAHRIPAHFALAIAPSSRLPSVGAPRSGTSAITNPSAVSAIRAL